MEWVTAILHILHRMDPGEYRCRLHGLPTVLRFSSSQSDVVCLFPGICLSEWLPESRVCEIYTAPLLAERTSAGICLKESQGSYIQQAEDYVMMYGSPCYSQCSDSQHADFALFKSIKRTNCDIKDPACCHVVHILPQPTSHESTLSTQNTMVNALKMKDLPLCAGTYGNSTKRSTRQCHQANESNSSLEAERVRALISKMGIGPEATCNPPRYSGRSHLCF